MRAVRHIAAALVIAAGAAMGAQQPPDRKRTFSPPGDYADVGPAPATTSELRDLIDRFALDRAALQRFYTIAGSTARRERLRAFYDAWLAKLPALGFEALSQEGKVDYVLLRNRLEYERALLGREARNRRETDALVPFFDDIARLQEDRQRLSFVTAEEALTAVRGVDAKVAAARARIEEGLPASPAVALRAAAQVDLLSSALGQWFSFYSGYDPPFTAVVPQPYLALNRALTWYAALLREKLAGLPPGTGQPVTEGGGRGARRRCAGRPRERGPDRRRPDRARRPARRPARRDASRTRRSS